MNARKMNVTFFGNTFLSIIILDLHFFTERFEDEDFFQISKLILKQLVRPSLMKWLKKCLLRIIYY